MFKEKKRWVKIILCGNQIIPQVLLIELYLHWTSIIAFSGTEEIKSYKDMPEHGQKGVVML